MAAVARLYAPNVASSRTTTTATTKAKHSVAASWNQNSSAASATNNPVYVDLYPPTLQGDVAVTVGRSLASTFVFNDSRVSFNHFVIESLAQENGGYEFVLTDSSTNGTTVAGVEITRGQSVSLNDADEIRLPHDETLDPKSFTFVFRHLKPEKTSDSSEPGDALQEIEREKELEAWKVLQDQCQALAVESSRLAAKALESEKKFKSANQKTRELCQSVLAVLSKAEERMEAMGDSEGARSLNLASWQQALEDLDRGVEERKTLVFRDKS